MPVSFNQSSQASAAQCHMLKAENILLILISLLPSSSLAVGINNFNLERMINMDQNNKGSKLLPTYIAA